MPRFKLTLTYEYDTAPEAYFDEVPAEITDEVLQQMIDIDSSPENIRDFIDYILSTGDFEGMIEAVG